MMQEATIKYHIKILSGTAKSHSAGTRQNKYPLIAALPHGRLVDDDEKTSQARYRNDPAYSFLPCTWFCILVCVEVVTADVVY
jgi:hypothetical protein